MSNHLPECGVSFACAVCGNRSNRRCICDRLRACEQRLLRNHDCTPGWTVRCAMADGYRKALVEVDEAIAAMTIKTAGNSAATVEQVHTVISKLKELLSVDDFKEKP